MIGIILGGYKYVQPRRAEEVSTLIKMNLNVSKNVIQSKDKEEMTCAI